MRILKFISNDYAQEGTGCFQVNTVVPHKLVLSLPWGRDHLSSTMFLKDERENMHEK